MLGLAVALLLGAPLAHAKTLQIDPVGQSTKAWCWVSTAEMVFRHNGIPSDHPHFQCGLIQFAFKGTVCGADCRACVNQPALAMDDLVRLIESYPPSVGGRSLRAEVGKALSRTEIIREIDAGRPIIAGVSPGGRTAGVPAHVVLIVGYEGAEDDFVVIVNDPYPYALERVRFGRPDPYPAAGGRMLKAGQYRIKLRDFTRGLRWTESIHGIGERGANVADREEGAGSSGRARSSPTPTPTPTPTPEAAAVATTAPAGTATPTPTPTPTAAAVATPAPAGTSTPGLAPDSAEARLARLKALRDQKLITAEEYAAKKAEILGEL